jgi:hypothetical protein
MPHIFVNPLIFYNQLFADLYGSKRWARCAGPSFLIKLTNLIKSLIAWYSVDDYPIHLVGLRFAFQINHVGTSILVFAVY